MKKIKLVILVIFLVISIFSVKLTLATTCSPSSLTWQEGDSLNKTITCTGGEVNRTIIIQVFGNHFSIDSSTIGSSEVKSIKITFSPIPGTPGGGLIFFDDIYHVPVTMTTMTIDEEEPTTGCRLIELPHTTDYRVIQGETGVSTQIRIKVSTECPSALSMSVIELIQMNKPMYLQGQSGDISPGEVFSFTIGIDAQGVSTGYYPNTYIVSGSSGDEIYEKSVNLRTIVTVGTSPITNQTFSSMPSCSINSEMLINNTYLLTCMNDNPNIEIEVPYNELFEGVSLSESQGKFEYKVKPIKVGTTYFMALFKYKGFVIGNPFYKEVRITSSPSQLIGNTMYFQFFPSLDKIIAGTTVNVLVKDNKTNTVLPDAQLYKNGVKLDTNSFTINEGEEVIITASLAGFPSIEETITPKTDSVAITLTKSNLELGEVIQINTNPEDAILILDGTREIPHSISFDTLGEHIITAKKSGYLSSNKTINVEEKLQTISMIPQDIKMNEIVYIDLNKEAPWVIYWRKNNKSNDDVYFDEQNIPYSKTSNRIEFKPMDKGIYTISLRGQQIAVYDKSGWSFKFRWWYLLILGLIGLLFWVVKGGKKRRKRGGIGYGSYTGGPVEEVTEVIK